jgi:hypothetical protein
LQISRHLCASSRLAMFSVLILPVHSLCCDGWQGASYPAAGLLMH